MNQRSQLVVKAYTKHILKKKIKRWISLLNKISDDKDIKKRSSFQMKKSFIFRAKDFKLGETYKVSENKGTLKFIKTEGSQFKIQKPSILPQKSFTFRANNFKLGKTYQVSEKKGTLKYLQPRGSKFESQKFIQIQNE